MAKKQDYTWILYVGIIGLLFFGGRAGWFGTNVTNMFGTQSTINPDPQTQLYSYSVAITLMDNPSCAGEDITGTIQANIPNGLCTVFYNAGSGWNPLFNANLDATGYYTTHTRVNTPGTASVRAVCCDTQGNCRVSNTIQLVVLDCSYVDDNTACNNACTAHGFVSGRVEDRPCTGTEVFAYAEWGQSGGTPCCCLPGGGGGSWCQDTDNGLNWPVIGSCTQSGTSQVNTDDCFDAFQQRDYYCSSPTGGCIFDTHTCPTDQVCAGGVCVARSCESILNPSGQPQCSTGVCTGGMQCYYSPASMGIPAKCICGI